ncbi:hypothetical protein [Xylophilus sp. Leaf220]|uniref:hypothetical protein n=1 Tax=Xylophilus sp. Leaf220 TaxID=1735686 RepID=UPI0006F56AE8|nr:hypothetical protein [Xylophilus sp. Leaf220]KQM79843.1 hypothetical protein ASE76_01155 [Xylophilus sp. Leaf220]
MTTVHLTIQDTPSGLVRISTDAARAPAGTTPPPAQRLAVELLSLAAHTGFAIEVHDTPIAANLEGLAAALLGPHPAQRDAEGYLTHPALPILDEGINVRSLLMVLGLETSFVCMEDDCDLDHPAVTSYEHGDGCAAWTPTPPAGDGWVLVEIYDTEDGVYALYCRGAA